MLLNLSWVLKDFYNMSVIQFRVYCKLTSFKALWKSSVVLLIADKRYSL